jgi:NAD(P)-dependent dehydrogenase (short-subunit alcohol dehydrogenase family)
LYLVLLTCIYFVPEYFANKKNKKVMNNKVWFITGASRGFGKIWAEAALKRGDKVAATARNTNSLKDLVDKYGDAILPLQLDVTNRSASTAAVKKAKDKFGRLDVVINNAGYGLFGMIEEVTEQQARAQIETNVFGALWVTQAVLPIMREQKSGHIMQVSSIGGIVAFPNLGMYHASKWALEGFTTALSKEVEDFGIHVTLIEPAGYATDWAGSSAEHVEPNPAYDELKKKISAWRSGMKRGVPEATAEAILKIVDADKPPLRLFLGEMPINMAKEDYAKRIATWEEWQTVSAAAQGN